jgi:hypothetical protein
VNQISITHVRRDAVRGKSIRHIDISGPDIATLESAGCEVTDVRDGHLDLDARDVIFVTGNAAWFPKLFRQLADTPAGRRPLIVIRHDEPLPPPAGSGLPAPRLTWREWARILSRDPNATDCYTNARFLRRLAERSLPDLLVVSSLGQQEYLAAHGIASEFVPKGWRSSYGEDQGIPRTIDVLSLGSHQGSRRRHVVKSLRRRGIEVTTIGDYFDPTCYGVERTLVLNRTKILLNILRDPGLSLGQSRLSLGMANGALVISEPLYRPDPFMPGRHYISVPVVEMPAAIDYFLEHDAERRAIVAAAHRHVRSEVTETAATARILDLIREKLASGRRSPAAVSRRDHPLETPGEP